MDGSNKDVGFDNVNAGDGENKVDLGDVYNGGGDIDDDVGVDDVGRVMVLMMMVMQTLILVLSVLIY